VGRIVDIHKAGGIIIRDRHLLIERSRGKEIFNAPGGKLEAGETAKQALIRELYEEFQIDVAESELDTFGTFYAQASGQEDKSLRMDVFTVKGWRNEIIPDNEIEEIRWVRSKDVAALPIGSVFKHEVIPRLKNQGLID
jgi:8-oxo-dGTP diphosphatase